MPHMTHHKAMTQNCIPGSGEWLFRKKEFIEWRKSSVSSILWLHGIREFCPYIYIEDTV